MTRYVMAVLLMGLLAACFGSLASADPVKWSAPMNQYPNPWSPTAAPPAYNPYGYSYYPYGSTPYGVQPGYGGQGGYYQAPQQGYSRSGASGNPYHPYYGGQYYQGQ